MAQRYTANSFVYYAIGLNLNRGKATETFGYLDKKKFFFTVSFYFLDHNVKDLPGHCDLRLVASSPYDYSF